MRIEVNLDQKWSEVAYFYTSNPNAMEEVMKHVEGKDKRFDLLAMTCGELCTLIDGGVPESLRRMSDNCTLRQYCRLVRSIRDGVRGFMSFLEKTTPPQTPLQRQSATGLIEITMEESVLLTLKSFYNLHSLEDAQRMSVYEYMIARRSEYNRLAAEYNMNRIIEMRHGKK